MLNNYGIVNDMNLIEMIGGWNEVLGWIGSATLLFSMTRSDMLKLRIFNTIGTAVMIVYTFLIASWPMLALNLVITYINVTHIRRILQEKTATTEPQERKEKETV